MTRSQFIPKRFVFDSFNIARVGGKIDIRVWDTVKGDHAIELMLRQFSFQRLKEMLVPGDITPARFALKVDIDRLGLFAFPCAGENVDFMSTRMRCQSGG